MSKRIQTLIGILLLYVPNGPMAQERGPAGIERKDSVAMEVKKLGMEDIRPFERERDKIKIISGSRFAIAAGELPFTTHVITKEEIRENGYETLVDALKMAPGIFTSQPGSAIEGETFLMRGLLGNAYTKILINDIPVKPAFVAGMPIGAQLPVREAERIEIIYGAGASLYGADASAGVINIITRQSERPVYMQADLSVGAGQYSSASVMFGGKWGRDKNILHYFAYGSNVLYNDRYLKRNFFSNYNPDRYPWLSDSLPDLSILPNYQENTVGLPLINNTPHLSRKFGLYLQFKRITLSVETMTRRDHSSTGLNPAAVSYANPLTYTGETIQRINLNFFKEKKNRNQKTDITFTRYLLDRNSSFNWVQPIFGIELMNVAKVRANLTTPDDSTRYLSIYQDLYKKYLSGTRYLFAGSNELRIEHVRNYQVLKRSSLTIGGNFRSAGGMPLTQFMRRPLADECANFLSLSPCDARSWPDDLLPFIPKLTGRLEGNFFGQWFYSGTKLNMALGFNYSSIINTSNINWEKVWLPRVAALYKVNDRINIRSSWGRSYRAPGAYYESNTYLFTSDTLQPVVSRPFTKSGYKGLKAETATSWESGIRYLTDRKIDFDLTWFFSQTRNLISFGTNRIANNPDNYTSVLGYRNASGSVIKYNGGQLTAHLSVNEKMEGLYIYSWIKSGLTKSGFDFDFFATQYTARIHQMRLVFRPFPTSTLILDVRGVRRIGETNPNFTVPDTRFITFDLVGRYAFTDQLETYFKINNLTNKIYPGLPATRTPDDLRSNQQFGIFARIGMNYYIE